jgi:hypothetical protein
MSSWRHYNQALLRRTPHLVLAFLFPLALYARTSSFDYVRADDLDLIAANQTFLGDLGNARRAFGQSYFETDDDPTGPETYYRPATILSFMLDAQRGGGDPRPYHVTNVVLHSTASALLLILAVMSGASAGAALAAALVFAAHPVNVQAVAWIAGRNELLLAVFGLASIIAWAAAGRTSRHAPFWIAAHSVLFAVALFSKETGVLVPMVAVLHQHVGRERRLERIHWVGLGVDALVLATWIGLRSRALADAPAMGLGDMLGVAASNSPQILLQVGKLIAPVRLNVSPGVDAMGLLLGAASLAGLAWLARRLGLRRRPTVVALCWLLAFLVPPLVVPGLPAYEHRNYLPLLGLLCIFAAASPRGVASAGLAGALVIVFAWQAYGRQAVFRDAFAYWDDGTRDVRFAPIAHVNLGQLHEASGRLEEAREQYVRALALDPNTPKAYNNLGVVAMKLNDPNLGVWYFNEEVRRHPSNAEAWYNLGLAAENLGRAAEARGHYERAIQANRWFRPAYEKLGLSPPS